MDGYRFDLITNMDYNVIDGKRDQKKNLGFD
jgi:hypothetical protein